MKAKHLFLLVVVFFLLWLGWIVIYPELESDPGQRASQGDSFGSFTALVSSFNIALIIYAVLLQRKEFALQRDELIEMRSEAKNKRQADTYAQFVIQLGKLDSKLKDPAYKRHRRDLCQFLIKEKSNDKSRLSGTASEYMKWLNNDLVSPFASPYIKLSILLLKMIHEWDTLPEAERIHYANLIMPMLSDEGKELIKLHSIFFGVENEDYSLLNHLIRLHIYHNLHLKIDDGIVSQYYESLFLDFIAEHSHDIRNYTEDVYYEMNEELNHLLDG